jgi:excisionase family DNA binding protein
MDNFYSINTAAARLDCHPETIRRLIKRGELTAAKVGREWRVSEPDLLTYLAARTVQAKDVSAP